MKKENKILILAFISGVIFMLPLYVHLFAGPVRDVVMYASIPFGALCCLLMFYHNYLSSKGSKG